MGLMLQQLQTMISITKADIGISCQESLDKCRLEAKTNMLVLMRRGKFISGSKESGFSSLVKQSRPLSEKTAPSG
jgi:hypothetical protein